MYYQKTDHPRNFSYAEKNIHLTVDHLGEDVYRLGYSGKRWANQSSRAVLGLDVFNKSSHRGSVETLGRGFKASYDEKKALVTLDGEDFGVLGSKWVVNLEPSEDFRFFGLGEKNTGFEKSGLRTKFWNTDVWSDFHPEAYREGTTDPMYASIPYLLMDTGKEWVGILVNNPYPVFMLLQPEDSIAGGLHGAPSLPRRFSVGAAGGVPELYLILGASPRDVTVRMQRLVGTTPLPPLWALGYHQSRWGYGSFADLDRLDKKFAEEKIPCDGLWLDIDYMDGFRVFSFNEKYFPHPKNQLEDLKKRGRRVVPILDPGIKVDPAYDVFRDGSQKDLFCKNSEGLPFVGFVWPGETVFPDFSLPETREWWASLVKKFAGNGIEGIWLDMHDPSTGCVDPSEMLFARGKLPHEAWHNQYCLGMQEATREGMLRAHPTSRPFILSRSAFVSSGRYTALWTGDNWSNRHHLKQCIPVSLSLSLSGLPFCGPDVPGFGGDADGDLATAWYKTCFLFPFFRNHSVKNSRDQEPWAFGEKTKAVLKRFIRLRYKMIPYLYNLFIEQENQGEPILRPLFYEFPEEEKDRAGTVDEFLVGRSVLQAPVLAAGADSRTVRLPGENLRWFSPSDEAWLEGSQTVKAKEGPHSTPLYIREGSILPMLRGEAENQEKNLSAVEFHVFLSSDSLKEASCTYTFDDGETFGYRKGIKTSFRLTAAVSGKDLRVEIRDKTIDYIPCTVTFVLYGKFKKVVFADGLQEEHLATEKFGWDFLGKKLSCRRTKETVVRK